MISSPVCFLFFISLNPLKNVTPLNSITIKIIIRGYNAGSAKIPPTLGKLKVRK